MYTDPSGENFLGLKSPGEWFGDLFRGDDNNDGVVGDRVFGGDAKQFYTDYIVYSNTVVISTALGGSAGMYMVEALGVTGYSAGFIYGFTSGFTRGFLTESSFTWYKGGSFEDGLRNGAISGLREGLSDAVTNSTMFGGTEMKWWQFVLSNNIKDNVDMFEGDGLQVHIGPVGWDWDDRNGRNKGFYGIWDKNINGGRRMDMAMESFWGVSLIPNFKYTEKVSDGYYSTSSGGSNGCKRGGRWVSGAQYETYRYKGHEELTLAKEILFPFWYYFYGY